MQQISVWESLLEKGHSLSHGCKEKTNPDVSNNYNVANSFLFPHLNPDLVVLHKNAVKPQQSSCKRPPFLRLSLNLKKVPHLEMINVPNHFLWLAVVFHMKELLWNMFSKSVFTFSFSRQELLSLQVIALPQGQVKNEATDFVLWRNVPFSKLS